MTEALIVHGGWEGHRPAEVASLLAAGLEERGVRVELSDRLDVLADAARLAAVDVVVPVWTMGTIEPEPLATLLRAVEAGLGLAGCHGMCDAFRTQTEYQFATGGQFVAHPGGDGVRYAVRIADAGHEITRGLEDFTVASEQYYLHVDPANHVLATTRFPVAEGPHAANGEVEMPVAWTRRHGQGRVFYCSLGHTPAVLQLPPAAELVLRGIAWATRNGNAPA